MIRTEVFTAIRDLYVVTCDNCQKEWRFAALKENAKAILDEAMDLLGWKRFDAAKLEGEVGEPWHRCPECAARPHLPLPPRPHVVDGDQPAV